MSKANHEKNCRLMRAARLGYEARLDEFTKLGSSNQSAPLTSLMNEVTTEYTSCAAVYNSSYPSHVDDFKTDAPTQTTTAVAISEIKSELGKILAGVEAIADEVECLKRRLKRQSDAVILHARLAHSTDIRCYRSALIPELTMLA
jgi:hypothetical protein